jgi:hypothetical protein
MSQLSDNELLRVQIVDSRWVDSRGSYIPHKCAFDTSNRRKEEQEGTGDIVAQYGYSGQFLRDHPCRLLE